PQGRPCRALHLARGEEMVEVGVRVHDGGDRQAQLLQLLQDARGVAARIHHDGLLGRWVADDRAIASQGRHREGAEDHEVSCLGSLKGWPAESQVFLLTMIGALNSTARAIASEERLSKIKVRPPRVTVRSA